MALTWTWWAVPSTVTLVVAWAAAIAVLRTRPDRSVNRRLFVVLVLEGLFIAASSGLIFLVQSRTVAFALGVTATAATLVLIPQYLSFLSVSLDTKLVAPFRGARAFVALAALSLSGAGVVIAFPYMFVTEPYTPSWAAWNYQLVGWGRPVSQLHGLVSIFGFMAALAAYARTRRGGGARARAKWFAIAFGLRDLYVGVLMLLYSVVRPVPFWGDFLYNPGLGGVYLLYVVLLSYGVLQAELFDIQLRLKFALRDSTVAAFIAGSFFVGSELLEKFVPVHGMILGILTAAACTLALSPLRRLAERFANRVMQNVDDTPAYVEARKLEVYRAAAEAAMEDGRMTGRERIILNRLQEKLGLSQAEVESIERETAEIVGFPRAAEPVGAPANASS